MADDITALTEGWRSLDYQMQPSAGAYSGNFKPGSDTSNDAQWLRQISLIVYGNALGGSGNGGGGGGTTPGTGTTSAPTRLRLVSPRDDPITLPDVNVTAPAPTPAAPASPPTGGQGLELGALRVTFNVHKRTAQTPDMLEARVYNMAPATMQKVLQFTRVQLSAGYQFANFGLLFDGTVVQYRRAKENPTDTYLEILAGDGDGMNGATSFRRFEAGTQESTAIKQLVQDTGYPLAHMDSEIGTQTLQRPWIVAGMTAQALREMKLKYKADYWVDQGQLYIVSQTKYLPGQVVVLAPNTGLVGIPELTPQGLQARCLINPKIRLGGLVKIDKTLISGIPYYPGSGGEMTGAGAAIIPGAYSPQTAQLPADVPTSPTGQYKIVMMEVSGDTRGQPWYMDLICLATDANGNIIMDLAPGSAFDRAYPGALT
jgi:hypothetical protein